MPQPSGKYAGKLKEIQQERKKEIDEFAEELKKLMETYNVSLDCYLEISPQGIKKDIIIIDNLKLT